MCLPQDPINKTLVRTDPLAKVDGRLWLQEKHGERMDPLHTAFNRKDPIQKAYRALPDPNKGSLKIERNVQ